MKSIAAFISPHGFGHAARASSVLSSLRRRLPQLSLEIFSTVPRWFFEDSLGISEFGYHPLMTDVGLMQRSALDEDLGKTIEKLSELLPYREEVLEYCSQVLRERGITHVLCDISPLGLVVAERCGLPSVLIENFTWDWIYGGYVEQEGRLNQYISLFSELFCAATIRIQTEPCHRVAGASFIAPPVSREPRISADRIRQELQIPSSQPLALLTMGGHKTEYQFTSRLKECDSVTFLVSSDGGSITRDGNLIFFPARSGYYHPDLVAASDLVIAKLGYSTMAEAWRSGVPLVYVARQSFREGALLEAFLKSEHPTHRIAPEEWNSGEWIPEALRLLGKKVDVSDRRNGGEFIADFLVGHFR